MANFSNYAGRGNVDDLVKAELSAAGLTPVELPFKVSGEVETSVLGNASNVWTFTRAWRYWIAEGPGIPPEYAEALHAQHGQVVRVAGHAGCPSPFEWHKGFAVGSYHVDTPEGLKALAETIAKVVSDAAIKHAAMS